MIIELVSDHSLRVPVSEIHLSSTSCSPRARQGSLCYWRCRSRINRHFPDEGSLNTSMGWGETGILCRDASHRTETDIRCDEA